jgi:hypothetical protein
MKESEHPSRLQVVNGALDALSSRPVELYKNNLLGTARGGFNAKGARARECIEHPRVSPLIRKPRLKPVKDRFAGPVWRWPQPWTVGHLKRSAPPLTPNNANLSHTFGGANSQAGPPQLR